MFVHCYRKYLTIINMLTNPWTSDKLIHYTLGGQAELAREFARIVCHFKTQQDASKEDENHVPERHEIHDNIIVTLDKFHKTDSKPVSVNLKDCMSFIMQDSDLGAIINGNFVKDNWDHIEMMGQSEIPVRLLDKNSDGLVDKSTWGDYDYSPLRINILRMIAIHSNHQQRCENFVQMAAIICKTSVKELRRTVLAICTSGILRPFNQQSLGREIARGMDRKERGARQIREYCEYVDSYIKDINIARDVLGKDKCTALHKSISTKRNKRSAAEAEAFFNDFSASLTSSKIPFDASYVAENETGYVVTALMGGKIPITSMTKVANRESHINAEIMKRGIPVEEKLVNDILPELKLKYSYDENWTKKINIREKQKLLKWHEASLLVLKNTLISLDDAMKQTTAFTPQSDECIELLLSYSS